jgi:SAM-dependent methyltransferase
MTERYDEIWTDVYGDMQDVGPVHRHMRRLVADMLAGLEYETAIEVGCGTGHNFDLIRRDRELRRLTGADISAVALERAERTHSGVDLVKLDIERETPPDRWDLVFSSLVLEHLVDDRTALANMAAMAGRHVVLTTIAGDFERYRPWDEQVGHVRNYRRGELEAKLAEVGLTVRHATYWGFPFYTPIQRTLQNRTKATATYSRAGQILAKALYGLYYLNSSARGDVLLVHAEATSRSDASSEITGS